MNSSPLIKFENQINEIVDKKIDRIILGRNSVLPIISDEALLSVKGYTSTAQTFISLLKRKPSNTHNINHNSTLKRVETKQQIVAIDNNYIYYSPTPLSKREFFSRYEPGIVSDKV